MGLSSLVTFAAYGSRAISRGFWTRLVLTVKIREEMTHFSSTTCDVRYRTHPAILDFNTPMHVCTMPRLAALKPTLPCQKASGTGKLEVNLD